MKNAANHGNSPQPTVTNSREQEPSKLAEFTALTLRFENCMARHTRVLMQVHHAATVALADEKMLGFPIPYAQYLEALRDTAHDALEEIAGIVRRRQQGRVQ